MNRDRWRRWVSWLSALAGLALLGVFASRVSWTHIASAFGEAEAAWLVAAVLLAVLGVSLRAVRLSLVLGQHATFPQTWRSVCLGYFGSLFLPFGGGEFVKVAALHRHAGVSLPRAGTALTMDRLFDVVTLIALLVGVLGHGMGMGLRMGPVLLLLLGMAALVSLLLLLLVSGNGLRNRLDGWASRHPGRHPWIHRFDEVHDQSKALRRPWLLPRLVLLQACIFSVDIVAAWCCLVAFPFGHGLPAMVPLRLAFFIMLAFGLPLLPGGFGSHQAATILALAPFGIGTARALAVSLAGEAAHLAALTAVGITAIAGSGLNPVRLARRPEVIDSPHPPEAP